ncbi:MAG: thiamine-phosphate kinase, partial [Planctomycetes bacterium]|nr:thiamine-phosphate kinase [Planctomycetota bacterium]
MVGERAFVAGLEELFGRPRGAMVGIGDDAAVVENRGRHSVLCCDPVIEGVHFVAADSPYLVGTKVVNRNLADLAAMGAAPDWLLASIVLPPAYPARRRHALLRGIKTAAERARCHVVGGDVAVADGPL